MFFSRNRKNNSIGKMILRGIIVSITLAVIESPGKIKSARDFIREIFEDGISLKDL